MADKMSKMVLPVKTGDTITNKEFDLPGGSSFDGDYNSLTNKPTLGTASAKDVPSSGNASSSQVVMGNDSRLTDSRNAKDVPSWAKAASKPTYTASEVGAIATSAKGAANGVAELDSSGKVPSSQLPSYVDDVLEYDNLSVFPSTGETGKIYVAKDTNKSYRWTGSAYSQIKGDLALGETSSTAYRGDRGKTAYDHSQSTHARTDATKTEASSTNGYVKINGIDTKVYNHPGSGTNPHGTTKSDVGLGNVPNVTTDNQTPSFTEASTRANIATGEKLSVIFGKIKKYFTDLKAVAFSGSYNDLSDKPTIPTNTDSKVSQTATTTSADYEVLFSSTADNTTRTEGARKNSNLKFNPSTGNLQATKLNGVDIGSSPKFTDNNTTYSNGTGLNLSGTTFSVKYGTDAGTACQGNDSRLSNARTPTSHASTGTGYGAGNASNYGHVKLSDNYTSSAGNASQSVAASSQAVVNVNNRVNNSLPVFFESTNVNPSFSLTSLKANVTYDCILTIYSKINSSAYQQEISVKLNNIELCANGNYYVLTTSVAFKASRTDAIHVSSYINGGSYSIFASRLICIPTSA